MGGHLAHFCTFGTLNRVDVFKTYSKGRHPINSGYYAQRPKIKGDSTRALLCKVFLELNFTFRIFFFVEAWISGIITVPP